MGQPDEIGLAQSGFDLGPIVVERSNQTIGFFGKHRFQHCLVLDAGLPRDQGQSLLQPITRHAKIERFGFKRELCLKQVFAERDAGIFHRHPDQAIDEFRAELLHDRGGQLRRHA